MIALLALTAACGTASANPAAIEAAEAAEVASAPSSVPESFITPDDGRDVRGDDDTAAARPVEFVPISIDEILHAAVGAVDADLWAAGYFGECPTPESLGIDPLSSEAISGPAAVTGEKVCSWQSTNADGVVLASLDRLDVLGDEAQYFVALRQDPNRDWRLATESERASLEAPGLTENAIFLNDHLVSSDAPEQVGA